MGVSVEFWGRVNRVLIRMYGDRLVGQADVNAMIENLGAVEQLYRGLGPVRGVAGGDELPARAGGPAVGDAAVDGEGSEP